MSTNYLSTPLPPANSGVGLGYGIAIAVGILVLISTIMLASYVCVRVKGGSHSETTPPQTLARTSPESDTVEIVTGLDDFTIESYPKFVFGSTQKPDTGPCPICLSEYGADEIVRCMPECGHLFHVGCLDEWLRSSATCPFCRNSPAPSNVATPMATPLSELIPLAAHGR